MEYNEILSIVNFIRAKTNFCPKIAVILGSGLGTFAGDIDIKYSLNYSDIPSFPTSTVQGHAGRFVFGHIKDIPLVLMQGRFHNYEGYSPQQIVLPVRIMRMLGAKILILTNAAGGISYKQGSLMAITGHISNFVTNPMIGKNIDELGPRFFDMSNVYDKKIIEVFCQSAEEINLQLKLGTYIQLSGPSFETPAEIRMCKALGADAVGMSTVQEAIAARHCGFKVGGISFISNAAANENTKLAHAEVIENAEKISKKFKALLKNSIIKLAALEFDE